jgi:sulfur carrier protein ThiS
MLRKDKVEVEARTLEEALKKLDKVLGSKISVMLLQGEEGVPYIIAVNGKWVPPNKYPETALKNGDKITIYPPVSGGGYE